MVSLKRQIYGLPFMRPYRLWRARQIAETPRPVREGFSFASYHAETLLDLPIGASNPFFDAAHLLMSGFRAELISEGNYLFT